MVNSKCSHTLLIDVTTDIIYMLTSTLLRSRMQKMYCGVPGEGRSWALASL